MPYDPARDFSAVVPFGSVPNVTVISPAKGIKTLRDLVAAAKAGSLTFASAGVGSATHWAAERLRLSAGFKAVHVPFRGGPEALTEVVTGRVDFMCIGVSSGLAFIREGKLLPLAVSTPKRSPALPNVMTTLEAGFPNSDYIFWMGMLVPAKTPRDIVTRLHQETQKALRHPNVVEKFAPQGIDPHAACSGRIRCSDQEGDRQQQRARQSGGSQVQLTKRNGRAQGRGCSCPVHQPRAGTGRAAGTLIWHGRHNG